MQGTLTKPIPTEPTDVLIERCAKQLHIESESMVRTGRRMILPAAWQHQARSAQTVVFTEQAGVDCRDQKTALAAFVELVYRFSATLAALAEAATLDENDDAMTHAHYMQEKVSPLMDSVRSLCDELESQVAADLWPLSLSTHREMPPTK